MFETLKYNHANIMAVCDVDSKRLKEGKEFVNDYYTKKYGKPYDGVKMYSAAQELLNNKDIDAVLISTPDHSHAYLGVLAAEARKDIYLQKPTALTIQEGRALSNAVHKQGCILQIGSQQRSSTQFRYAAELVRNGRIGKLKEVLIGLPKDPGGDVEPEIVEALVSAEPDARGGQADDQAVEKCHATKQVDSIEQTDSDGEFPGGISSRGESPKCVGQDA